MNNVSNKGVYYIIIKLFQNHYIKIGCLGTFSIPAGFYVYVGSSQNNLERRIERHLRREKKFHWHIDYLLHYGKVISVQKYSGEKSAECLLNCKIGNIRNAKIPAKGFGSSDCTCVSHLHFFLDDPEPMISKFKANVSSAKTYYT